VVFQRPCWQGCRSASDLRRFVADQTPKLHFSAARDEIGTYSMKSVLLEVTAGQYIRDPSHPKRVLQRGDLRFIAAAPPSAPGKKIAFKITIMTGGAFSVTMMDTATTEDLKLWIHEQRGIPPEAQRLVCLGARLQLLPCSTLRSMGVKSGSEVQVVLRPRGGMLTCVSDTVDGGKVDMVRKVGITVQGETFQIKNTVESAEAFFSEAIAHFQAAPSIPRQLCERIVALETSIFNRCAADGCFHSGDWMDHQLDIAREAVDQAHREEALPLDAEETEYLMDWYLSDAKLAFPDVWAERYCVRPNRRGLVALAPGEAVEGVTLDKVPLDEALGEGEHIVVAGSES